MKSFLRGQAVRATGDQLRSDGASATVLLISPNAVALVLEFSSPVALMTPSGGMVIGLTVAITQHEDGRFEDLFGNLWQIEHGDQP